jgi:hypothetical protein
MNTQRLKIVFMDSSTYVMMMKKVAGILTRVGIATLVSCYTITIPLWKVTTVAKGENNERS